MVNSVPGSAWAGPDLGPKAWELEGSFVKLSSFQTYCVTLGLGQVLHPSRPQAPHLCTNGCTRRSSHAGLWRAGNERNLPQYHAAHGSAQ